MRTSSRLLAGILAAAVVSPAFPQESANRPAAGSPQDVIANHRDLGKVIEAVQALHGETLKSCLQLIRERMAAEKARGNKVNVTALAELEEKYAILSYKGNPAVPIFLWKDPASFSVQTKQPDFRFVAFGDFGKGTDDQKRVAAAMRAEHGKNRFEFGITLGDNFYRDGMHAIDDERWEPQWEQLYGPMGIKFYASLGNHDWYYPDSPASEMLYSLKSESWYMPTAYYSYTAGNAEFFALNTEVPTEKQLMWLDEKLKQSKARWKVVYGHHPIYSGSRQDSNAMIEKLLPIVRGRADVYLAGHDHVLAHLKPEQGTEFFVSGGGGASNYEIRKDNPLMLFGQSAYGYLTVDVTTNELRYRFVGPDGKELYAYTQRKAGT